MFPDASKAIPPSLWLNEKLVAAGLTELEADEELLVPAELEAVTLNVYVVPPLRPLTAQEVEVEVQLSEPGDEVTV